jgi:RNA polymerase-binding transcription factor DksA
VPLHLADLGSHDFEQEFTLGLLEKEEQLAEEINAALARMDQGVFGRCEAGRHEIPKGRLRVLPYTRYCVTCAGEAQVKSNVTPAFA